MHDLSSLRREAVLVTDFDGTMTTFDFFERALAHCPPDMPNFWGMYEAGQLSHFEALKEIYARIPGGEGLVLEIAHQAVIDPRVPDAVARLHAAGWDVVIVSAGCEWYIERLLAEVGVQLPLLSNPGSVSPQGGLHMTPPTDSPFFSRETGINKEAVLEWALRTHRTVAFAGDGRPDLPPSLRVPPAYRFARGWLADALREQRQPFHSFTRWSRIADTLLSGK